MVQKLIEKGADVNSMDHRKVSCLMAAFRKGHIKVVELLVKYVTQFPSDKDCVRQIKTVCNEAVHIHFVYSFLFLLPYFTFCSFISCVVLLMFRSFLWEFLFSDYLRLSCSGCII